MTIQQKGFDTVTYIPYRAANRLEKHKTKWLIFCCLHGYCRPLTV